MAVHFLSAWDTTIQSNLAFTASALSGGLVAQLFHHSPRAAYGSLFAAPMIAGGLTGAILQHRAMGTWTLNGFTSGLFSSFPAEATNLTLLIANSLVGKRNLEAAALIAGATGLVSAAGQVVLSRGHGGEWHDALSTGLRAFLATGANVFFASRYKGLLHQAGFGLASEVILAAADLFARTLFGLKKDGDIVEILTGSLGAAVLGAASQGAMNRVHHATYSRRGSLFQKPAKPYVIAHRGMHDSERENSMAAFDEALHSGAHGFETDAHMTADGHVVIHHDAAIAMGAHGNRHMIRNLTLRELQGICVQEYGAPIPTLGGMLDRFLENPRLTLINLELKDQGSLARNRRFATVLQKTLNQYPRAAIRDRIAFSSFHPMLLRTMKRWDDGIRSGFLIKENIRTPKSCRAWFALSLADDLHPEHSWYLNDHSHIVWCGALRAFPEAEISPWTLTESSHIRTLLGDARVFQIITDTPLQALRLHSQAPVRPVVHSESQVSGLRFLPTLLFLRGLRMISWMMPPI